MSQPPAHQQDKHKKTEHKYHTGGLSSSSNSRTKLIQNVEKFGKPSKLQFFEHEHIGNRDDNHEFSRTPPLILMIGWYGSSFRFVSKYADIYTKVGYDVLAYIPDSLELFVEKYSMQGAITILDLLEKDQRETETGFTMHCFSNNGGLFLANLMSAMEQENQISSLTYTFVRRQFRGLIADSFPGFNTTDTGAIAVLSGYNYDRKHGKIADDKHRVGFIAMLMRWFFYYLFYFYYYVSSLYQSFAANYQQKLRKIPQVFNKDTPILVIYAKNDFIVPYDQVEMFWKNYSGMDQSNLRLKCFEGEIEHIRIFTNEPEKYTRELETFMHNFLPLRRK